MTKFSSLPHLAKFKFKNPAIDGGEIRTKIVWPDLFYEDVLTEETVETTTEEWTFGKKFCDLQDGDKFKFFNMNDDNIMTKRTVRNKEHIGNQGFSWDVPKYGYYYAEPMDDINRQIWTLEKVTKTEKKWV